MNFRVASVEELLVDGPLVDDFVEVVAPHLTVLEPSEAAAVVEEHFGDALVTHKTTFDQAWLCEAHAFW